MLLIVTINLCANIENYGIFVLWYNWMKYSSNLFFDITTFPEITIISHFLLKNM